VARCELVERFSTQAADNLSEKYEIDIAIYKARAWGGLGFFIERHLDARLIAAPGRLEIKIGAQSREMRHQITNCDGAFAAFKFRQVFRDSVVEPQLA